MTSLSQLTIHEVHSLLRRGEVSSYETTQAVLDRILSLDNDVKAYLTLAPELALAQAAEADQRRADGEDHPLLGVPVAIKDVISIAGLPTTCGSRILEEYVPPSREEGRLEAILLFPRVKDEVLLAEKEIRFNCKLFFDHNPTAADTSCETEVKLKFKLKKMFFEGKLEL